MDTKILTAKSTEGFPFTFYIEKAKPIEENGEFIVEGVASTVNVDHDKERFSMGALKNMVNIVNTKGVPLRVEHNTSDDGIIGDVYKAWLDERGQMWIRARLDKANQSSTILYNSLKSGAKLGLSVGGRIMQAVKYLADNIGKNVNTFFDVILDEVSITSKPANYDTYLYAKNIKTKHEDITKYYDSELYNDFLFENPHLDYAKAFAKAIPDDEWEKVDEDENENIMKIFRRKNEEGIFDEERETDDIKDSEEATERLNDIEKSVKSLVGIMKQIVEIVPELANDGDEIEAKETSNDPTGDDEIIDVEETAKRRKRKTADEDEDETSKRRKSSRKKSTIEVDQDESDEGLDIESKDSSNDPSGDVTTLSAEDNVGLKIGKAILSMIKNDKDEDDDELEKNDEELEEDEFQENDDEIIDEFEEDEDDDDEFEMEDDDDDEFEMDDDEDDEFEMDDDEDNDEYGEEYKMPEVDKAIKSLFRALKTMKKKQKPSILRKSATDVKSMEKFSKAVSKAVQATSKRLEEQGKRIIGFEKMIVDSFRENKEFQKAIADIQKSPSFKKSRALKTPYLVTKEGKRYELSATPVGVKKSVSLEGKSFKDAYKSEFSSMKEE